MQLLGQPEALVQTKDQQRGVRRWSSSSVVSGEWSIAINNYMRWMKENLKACILFYFLLSFSSVHVHNDFLLAILTRCQIIVSTPGIMCLFCKKLGIAVLWKFVTISVCPLGSNTVYHYYIAFMSFHSPFFHFSIVIYSLIFYIFSVL